MQLKELAKEFRIQCRTGMDNIQFWQEWCDERNGEKSKVENIVSFHMDGAHKLRTKVRVSVLMGASCAAAADWLIQLDQNSYWSDLSALGGCSDVL